MYELDPPDEYLARIEKVTVDDVNRVARRYPDPGHAIVAELTPQGSGKPVAAGGFGGQESIALGEAKPTPLPDWASAALGRLSVHRRRSTRPSADCRTASPRSRNQKRSARQ